MLTAASWAEPNRKAVVSTDRGTSLASTSLANDLFSVLTAISGPICDEVLRQYH